MNDLYVGQPVPHYPFLDAVVRGYAKWEEQNYPKDRVRCGISAEVALRVWNMGMSTPVLATLRDCTAVVFAYCFNGLRESSVMTLLTSKVSFLPGSMSCRLSYWKGRQVSKEPLVQYSRIAPEISSPVDLFHRWSASRGIHERFFALHGDPVPYQKESLTRALTRCLEKLDVLAPPDGKYTSHSLRIGAHTEQVRTSRSETVSFLVCCF